MGTLGVHSRHVKQPRGRRKGTCVTLVIFSFLSRAIIMKFFFFIQSGQNYCYYFDSCANSSNKCRLRPGCCQQFNQQQSKSPTQRFLPPPVFSFFSFLFTLVTARGQRLMNFINLDRRPRRVLAFFSFPLSVLLLQFTASLFLSFIHASFLISPSLSFFSFPPVLLSYSISLFRSVPAPFLLSLSLSSCPSSFTSCPYFIFLFSFLLVSLSLLSSLTWSLCHSNVGVAWCHRPPRDP